MSGNLPDGCDPNDPRFNEEDGLWAKCHICGDGGYVEFDKKRESFFCICESCGASVTDMGDEKDTVRYFEDGYYDTVTACPGCTSETVGLKVQVDVFGCRIACSCGVSANYGHDAEEALDNWNSLF